MVIKTLNIQNPFAGYGSIVIGDRFIGREYAIEAIHNRVLGEFFGNIAIMGLPRIGKTSLAWVALMPLKERLAQKQHYVSYIGVGTISNSTDFFKSLIQSALEEIEFSDLAESVQLKITAFFDKLKEVENNRFEFINQVQKIFKFLKRNGIRLTYILDEFDNVANIFSVADFQILRELSSKPETQICLITVSRRTIQELEPENGAISNFYGVFSELHLKLFSENDITQYWQRIENSGIELSNEYKKEVQFFVGSHPCWLNMVNYYIFNTVKIGSEIKSSVDLLITVKSELKKTLWDNYDHIISLMDKEGLKNHFIQAVVGPVLNLTKMSVEKLEKYGLITSILAKEKYGSYFQRLIEAGLATETDISYNSISEHLNEYLKQKEVEFDIWPLWNETEQKVREIIKIYLKDTFGDNWKDNFLTKFPTRSKKDLIESMEKMRDKNKLAFGQFASEHLVDYSYPLEMWKGFISTEWLWFQKILGGNESTWKERFSILAKVRNPIAHSNGEFVSEDDKNEAKDICVELLKKIRAWEEDK